MPGTQAAAPGEPPSGMPHRHAHAVARDGWRGSGNEMGGAVAANGRDSCSIDGFIIANMLS